MSNYKYRMFFMEPPIESAKTPETLEYKNTGFETACIFARDWVRKNKEKGTKILMIAQLNR